MWNVFSFANAGTEKILVSANNRFKIKKINILNGTNKLLIFNK